MKLPLGIVGFGAFGRLMARHLRPWFSLLAYDPLYGGEHDSDFGVRFADIAAVAACPVVVLATPVANMAEAIAAIRPHLTPGALVLDVGSVKVEPARLLLAGLPEEVEIVCTHPLFGPQSGREGIGGLKIAVCPVRGRRAGRVAAFLRDALGLSVYFTTPEEHDREAAVVQGLTHLIAKLLVQMEPLPRRLTTPSFDLLLRAIDMVRDDPPGVFLAIEKANPFAAEVRARFFAMAAAVRAALETAA
jgi:prephenate dehydrogenase